MFRLLFIALLTTTVFAHGTHDRMIKKYGEKKIYESCFGKTLTEEKEKWFHGLFAKCKADPMAGTTSAYSAAAKPTRTSSINLMELLAGSEVGSQALIIPLEALSNFRKQSPFRSKRSATYFNADRLRTLKNRAEENIALTLCVFRNANMLNNNNEVQWTEVRNKYEKLSIDATLKADLIEGFDSCKKFATCLPGFKTKGGPFPEGLKQILTYLKCERYHKIGACAKKELRSKTHKFELQGLEGFLDHLEDDDDRMAKVIFLEHKFGLEDYAAFE